MLELKFIDLAEDLESAGLLWLPEIGDEISDRKKPEQVSVLVDSAGKTPEELRHSYLWLPNLEQLVIQLEIRQAVLFHAGLELSEINMAYKAVVHTGKGAIESVGRSLRLAVGEALHGLLIGKAGNVEFH
ncbi:MAG: hypothetical protein R3A13_06035 [Bdellovibrionota bacterium]